MAWCDKINELNTSLIITLKYKGYKYSGSDTNNKVILYYMPNNYNSAPGYLQVSKSILYKNSGINQSQPYIEVYGTKITDGFIEGSDIKGGTGSFNTDTMTINFSVKLSSAPVYVMKCKYKKF